MVSVRSISIIVAACAALSACNTTDALTPRVGLGDEVASAPVTQNEVERMAAAPRQPTYGAGTQSSYQSSYQQQAYSNTGSSSATLDEQADALRNGGRNPIASKPIDDGQPQAAGDAGNGLPSQTDEQREADRRLADPQPQRRQQQASVAEDQPQAEQPQSTQPEDEQQPEQQQASLPPTAAADGNTIRFLPIIGAPVEAVTPLSRQLGVEARANGLTIKGSGDNDTAYILKGYLTTFADGPQITVSYVWDVLDSTGGRLHRIQGTESVPLKRGDPWAAVPPATMQKIAAKTIAEFNGWRQTRGG
ncbi:MAG: hypothetical protein ABWY49_13920 [Rhizobium sp.]